MDVTVCQNDDWEDAGTNREKVFRGDVGSLGMSFTSSTRVSERAQHRPIDTTLSPSDASVPNLRTLGYVLEVLCANYERGWRGVEDRMRGEEMRVKEEEEGTRGTSPARADSASTQVFLLLPPPPHVHSRFFLYLFHSSMFQTQWNLFHVRTFICIVIVIILR